MTISARQVHFTRGSSGGRQAHCMRLATTFEAFAVTPRSEGACGDDVEPHGLVGIRRRRRFGDPELMTTRAASKGRMTSVFRFFVVGIAAVGASLLAGCSSAIDTTPSTADRAPFADGAIDGDASTQPSDSSTADDSFVDGAAIADTGAHDAEPSDAIVADAPHPADAPTGACPPVTFPSGLTLARVEDLKIEAEYAALGASACATPKCFLDVTDLRDATGASVDIHALVAAHFQLYELVATDVDPNATGGVDPANAYSTRVLVDPDLVAHLETSRIDYGASVVLTSGFRSIAHQRAICNSICGADQCADASGTVTCARNSRHMWGAAADMGLEYEAAANAAGFPFVFHEGGGTAPHLHVDMQACH